MLHHAAVAVTLFLSATLFGSMLFFAAIVTPAAFKSLDKEHTGQYLQVLFPRYYLWGLIVSVLTAISTVVISWLVAAPVILVVFGFLLARHWLMPKINALRVPARSGDAQVKQQFKRLHGLSVLIHLAQMLLLIISFALTWRAL